MTDRYEATVQQEEYMKYAREGYGMLQNWMANQVLRISTGMRNATITTMTMPMRSEVIVLDSFDILLQTLFPLCMTLVYILPILRLTSRLVSEKVRFSTP